MLRTPDQFELKVGMLRSSDSRLHWLANHAVPVSALLHEGCPSKLAFDWLRLMVFAAFPRIMQGE